MAYETTPLGYRKPDGNDPARDGDNHVAHNAALNQTHVAALQGQVGQAMALINAGAGGPGLYEDPENPGLYYFAGTAFTADPANPGMYFFEVAP